MKPLTSGGFLRLTHQKFVVSLVFLSFSFPVFAANPSVPFSSQDNITDPNCLPSDSNCYIRQDNQVLTNATATNFYSTFFTSPSAFISGNMGIGTSSPVSKLTLQGGSFSLYATNTESVVSQEMITSIADRDFSADTGNWAGSGWLVGSGIVTHSPSTTTLSLSNSALSADPIVGNYYQISFDINTTATGTGMVSVSFGGTNPDVQYGSSMDGATSSQQLAVKAITTSGLVFTVADGTWAGTIDNVSIKQITPATVAETIYNADGTSGIEMRAGGTGSSNFFIGTDSGLFNTTGIENSFVGYQTGVSNTTGAQNSFFGYNAGIYNTTGSNNTYIGRRAGFKSTTGSNNTFIGVNSGFFNISGSNNAFVGVGAGFRNRQGIGNSFFGNSSGSNNTTGNLNTFSGYVSGAQNTSGSNNTFTGVYTGYSNSTGNSNAFFGTQAGFLNTVGSQNSFFGTAAGLGNTTGYSNTYVGYNSGSGNATGVGNVSVGDYSSGSTKSGNGNSFFGKSAGVRISTSTSNTMIGYEAGSGPYSLFPSADNTLLGYQAGTFLATSTGNLFMGYRAAANSTIGDYNVLLGYNNNLASTTGSNQLNIGNLLYGTSLGVNGVASAGNVGIGSTTPTSRLSVVGVSGSTNNLFTIASSTGNSLFTILPNGNIGIGTSTPFSKLQVDGVVTSGGSGYGKFSLLNAAGVDRGAFEFDGNFVNLSATSSFPLIFTTNASERLRVTPNGDVGIGTSTPASRLHVNGTITSGGSNQGGFSLLNAAGQTRGGLFYNGFVVDLNATNSFPLTLTTGDSERIRVTATGNVGIGTSTPEYLLHVGSSVVSGVVARFQNSTGYCDINPTSASLVCTSDERLKKNIENLSASGTEELLNKVMKIRPVTYNWNSEDNSSSTHAGFIAQDVQTVFPDLVSADPSGTLSVSYTGFIPYIVDVLKFVLAKVSSFDTTIVTKQIHASDVVCVGNTCINEDQLKSILNQTGATSQASVQAPAPQVPDILGVSSSTEITQGATNTPVITPGVASSSLEVSTTTDPIVTP